MSLEAWEERTLNSIAADLTASAPELASRLSVFNRLALGEQMPGHPQGRETVDRHHHSQPHRRRRDRVGRGGETRASLVRAANDRRWLIPVVFVVVMAAIVTAMALAMSGSSHTPGGSRGTGQCAQMWPLACQ